MPAPRRSVAPRKRGARRGRGCGWLLAAAGLLAGCALLGLVGVLAGPRLLIDPDSAPPPRVKIRVPSPGARLPADDERQIVVQAYEAGPIVRYELWLDGLLAAYRAQPDSGTPLPNSTQFHWRPDTPGAHVLVARAYDARGRIGRSPPVVVEAFAPASAGPLEVTYPAQPGDTLQALADAFGVPVEVVQQSNPGLPESPPPGEQVVIPVPRDRLPPGYLGDDAHVSGPTEDLGLPPGPAPQGSGEGGIGPVDNASPFQLPQGLAWRFGAPAPPTPPAELQASLTGGCGVQLRWSDNAEEETGFRLYRYGGGGGDFRPVADVGSNQQFASLVYDDSVPLGGSYQYYVAAVNSAGESPGPIAAIDVPVEGCAMQVPPVAAQSMAYLQFEAVSLESNAAYDRLYCYLSLAMLRQPYSRIPESEDDFMAPGEAGWNIDAYAAGLSRYAFVQAPDQPVPVAMECWAWSGGELTGLGSFSASHPREEWDGRDLVGAGAGFQAVYRIQPWVNLPAMRNVDLDLSIPAPYEVDLAEGPNDCRNHANRPGGSQDRGAWAGLWACQEIPPEHMLVWEWAENDETPRAEIDGFRVYRAIGRLGEAPPSERAYESLAEVGAATQLFPILMLHCDVEYFFRVEAFASEPYPRESPRSEAFSVPGPSCPEHALVEVTLETLVIEGSEDTDGAEWLCFFCATDRTQESYGFVLITPATWDSDSFGDSALFILWSTICGDRLLTGICPEDDPRGLTNGSYDLAEERIRTCLLVASEEEADVVEAACGPEEPGQNSARLLVRDGDHVLVSVIIWDEDGATGDDLVCGSETLIGGSSLRDWAAADFDHTASNRATRDLSYAQYDNLVNYDHDQDATCTLTVHFEGVGLAP